MIKFNDYIAEIKSTIPKSKWQWTEKGARGWAAVLVDGGLEVHLYIQKTGEITLEDDWGDGDVDEESYPVFQCDFIRDGSWDVTGTGRAKEIFAWVITRILEFMKTKPHILRFTAKQTEKSRQRLYDSMVKYVLRKEREYEWIKLSSSSYSGKEGKPYFIVHETITDEYDEADIVEKLTKYNSTYA